MQTFRIHFWHFRRKLPLQITSYKFFTLLCWHRYSCRKSLATECGANIAFIGLVQSNFVLSVRPWGKLFAFVRIVLKPENLLKPLKGHLKRRTSLNIWAKESGEWRRLHNEELHSSYSSRNTGRVINSRILIT